MNFWVHLIIAVLLTAYFVFRYVKDRQFYQLLFIIWVPTTLLTYLSAAPAFRITLGIFQVVMFVLVLFFMFKKPKQTLVGPASDSELVTVSEDAPTEEPPQPEPPQPEDTPPAKAEAPENSSAPDQTGAEA